MAYEVYHCYGSGFTTLVPP